MYLVISKCVTAVKVSNFTGHNLPNRSTLDIGVLGFFRYSLTEGTPSRSLVLSSCYTLYIYIYTHIHTIHRYVCVCIYTGPFILYCGITIIYCRKTAGHIFTKPVQIEGTTQKKIFPSKLFFIVVHISSARRCECM